MFIAVMHSLNSWLTVQFINKGLFIYCVIKGLQIVSTLYPLLFCDLVISVCIERYVLAYPLLPPSNDNVIYERSLTAESKLMQCIFAISSRRTVSIPTLLIVSKTVGTMSMPAILCRAMSMLQLFLSVYVRQTHSMLIFRAISMH